MTIDELQQLPINKSIAYIVGLSLPLYKTIEICGVDYLYGCVNHNANMITQEDLAYHYKKVLELLNSELGVGKVLILANQNDDKNINSKKGFSILIEKNGHSDSECIQILLQKANEISHATVEFRKEFARACFDGRSSWDTTAHYISLDVDRDYSRQDKIVSIIESLGIEININRRELNHPKNDQVRVKKGSVLNFINRVGFYSRARQNLVLAGLRRIGR